MISKAGRQPSYRSVLLSFAASLPSVLHAQTAPATPDAQKGSEQLEMIIVTAERHKSSAQDIAASLTALSAAALADENIDTVADVARSVPAVSFFQSAKGGSIYIRGVGGGLDPQIGSPGIALNLDGRFQDQASAAFGALYDVQRVEVLRGPQGTLYGRNATAGAVNIITNNPNDRYGGSASVDFGNYGARRYEAEVNLPVTDTLWLRAAGISDQHGAYLSNGLDTADTHGGRLKAFYAPTGNITWLVTGEILNVDSAPGTVVAPATARSNPWQAADSDSGVFGYRGYEHSGDRSIASEFNVDTAYTDITWLASYQTFKSDSDLPFAGQAAAMSPTDDDTSTELRFASPKGSTISWVGGLYYYRALKTDWVYTPASDSTEEYPSIDQFSKAVYGQTTIPLVGQLSATLGARYTADSQYNRGRIFNGEPSTGDDIPYFTGAGNWSHFDYKIGLDYQLTQASLLYVDYSTGYKAGGLFQGGPPDTYQPEVLKALAVGSKNLFLDGKLQINGEGYYYNYDHYQVQTVDVIHPVGYGLEIFNAANAVLYGGEIEAAYKLTAADRFDASVAVGKGQFGNHFVVPSVFGIADYSNEAIPHLPLVSSRLAYEHDWGLENGATLTFHVDTEISSGYWAEFTHIAYTYQESYHRTGLMLSYASPSGHWSLDAYARNLEDTPVIESAYQLPGSPGEVMLAAPRTYGVQLKAKF